MTKITANRRWLKFYWRGVFDKQPWRWAETPPNQVGARISFTLPTAD